jgi:hypothetical protein
MRWVGCWELAGLLALLKVLLLLKVRRQVVLLPGVLPARPRL